MKRLSFAAIAVCFAAACGTPGSICSEKSFGGPFCIPDSGIAAAGQKLKFEAVDQCNGGCGTGTLSCVVTRDGGTLTLAIAGQVCQPPPNVVCSAACALVKRPCELPALDEGDYTLVSENQTSQTLKVRDGGASGCTAVF
jgi:hypothetical protein